MIQFQYVLLLNSFYYKYAWNIENIPTFQMYYNVLKLLSYT